MAPSAIDAALIGKLVNDATLMALTTDGVYFGEGKPGLTAFTLVSLAGGETESVFGSRAIDSRLYLVKAVIKGTASANARAAADRIDALLQDGTLSVSGYNFMDCNLEEPIGVTEVDDLDQAIRWQHFGGFYRVQVSVIGV